MSQNKISEQMVQKQLSRFGSQQECVKVVIRCRPMIHKKEIEDGRTCVEMDPNLARIEITNPEDPARKNPFTYDALFLPGSTQQDVYAQTAAPIVESVLSGYNGTVIAYGQTGAGKTFTMEGSKEHPGLIPQCFGHIFDYVKKESNDRKFLVQCSMLQVYKEEVYDLLGKNTRKILKLRENTKTKEFIVKGLMGYMVNSAEAIEEIMRRGQSSRTVHATPMNPGSSRSHCLFQVKIETIETYPDGKEHVRSGKLQLVDLAGSERAKKTGGVRQEEMIKINWGLSCLGNVIMSLTSGKNKHIPYRDSKLTKLLQDSLGGNTKTVLVANISPSSYNYHETISTLRYASRAKMIKNKPKINEDPKDALIRKFQEQIELLKKQLASGNTGGGDGKAQMVSLGSQNVPGRVDNSILLKMKKEAEEEKKKLMMEMKTKTEQEKRKMEEQKQKLEKKQQEIESKLLKRKEELKQEKAAQEDLKKKLVKMQKQLVAGGEMKKKTEEMKEQLDKKRKQLEAEKVKAVEFKRLVQKKMQDEKELKHQVNTTKKEVIVKTKKLKQLWQKYKQSKEENEDLVEMFQQERQEYLFAIKNIERELKLKELIISNFIPPEEVEKIERRAVWNEAEDEFTLKNIQLSGNAVMRRKSALGYERSTPMQALEKEDPRYKINNVIDFDQRYLQYIDGFEEDGEMY